jgi:hypothetical protein
MRPILTIYSTVELMPPTDPPNDIAEPKPPPDLPNDPIDPKPPPDPPRDPIEAENEALAEFVSWLIANGEEVAKRARARDIEKERTGRTDSVSASVSIPLTIKVTAPPSLTAGGEIVKNGQVINLDAGNSSSILLADGTVATSRVWSDISGSKLHATTNSALYNSLTCNAPTYSADNGGILTFSAAAQTCYQTPFLGTHFTKSYTIESWVKLSSAMTSGMQIISQA